MLADYTEFEGRHYETGTVRNVLAYHGVVAPHTGEPPSEALLLGLSGGIAFGYFLFDYGAPGRLLSLLSRNTFDPFETLLDRLALPRDVRKTADPERAESILEATLEAGDPAIVWADLALLPYSRVGRDDGWWAVARSSSTAWTTGAPWSPIDRAGRCLSTDLIWPPPGAGSRRSGIAR